MDSGHPYPWFNGLPLSPTSLGFKALQREDLVLDYGMEGLGWDRVGGGRLDELLGTYT